MINSAQREGNQENFHRYTIPQKNYSNGKGDGYSIWKEQHI